jgi:integrase
LSASRVKNILMPIRSLYRWELRRDDGLVINPTHDLELPSSEKTRDRIASPDEVEQLLGVLAEGDRAVWACAFFGGLRRGELRALRWDDVDLAKGVIDVCRSWDDQVGEVEPKSRKGLRGVPVNGTLRDYLLVHKARTGRGGHDLVFGSTAANPFVPSTLIRRANAAWESENEERKKTGRLPLKAIGLHECRHSYVSWMFVAGHALEEIGDYVGHSSTYMTDRYRHLQEGHERRSVQRQDDYLQRSERGAQALSTGVVLGLSNFLNGADLSELRANADDLRSTLEGFLDPASQLGRSEH